MLNKASVPHPCDFFLSHGWESTSFNLYRFPTLFGRRGDREKDGARICFP